MPKPPTRSFVGIDPGKSGGIVIIEGSEIFCEKMPLSCLDIWHCIARLDCNGPITHIYLEKVHSSPQQGVRSAFTFGEGFGMLQMALAAKESYPHTLVTPQVWQRELGIPPRKKKEPIGSFKERLRAYAQRLYPKSEIWKGTTLTLQRSVSDAILIAEYGRRLHSGELKANHKSSKCRSRRN